MSIQRESKHAIVWSMIDKFLKRGIQFLLSIFLARLLTPNDYGIVAMAAIFVSWGEVFRDFGLGQSIIQKKDVTDEQKSTIFYINILMGCIIATIFFLIAPLAAQFYENEMVAWVVRVSGITFIIQSVNVVQHSILQKELNFKIETIASFYSMLISGLLGILLAYEGFGIWSLLFQSVMSYLIITIYIWIKTTWRPSLHFNFSNTKPMLRMGVGFMLQGLIDNIFNSLGSMVIGKLFSPSTLGLYSRGNSLAEMPKTTFIMPFTRPLFPVFAKIQDDKAAVRNYFLNTIDMLNWLMIFVTGIILTSSSEIICILYGDVWLDSAKYLFLLSIMIPFFPNWTTTTSLWKGLGFAKKVATITFIEKFFTFISIAGLFINLETYAIMFVASYIVACFIKSFMNIKISGISIKDQYKEWSVEMIIMILMIACLSFLKFESSFISFFIKTCAFSIVYFVISYVLKLHGYTICMNQLNPIIRRIKKI